jgi:dihydrofolate reductase
VAHNRGKLIQPRLSTRGGCVSSQDVRDDQGTHECIMPDPRSLYREVRLNDPGAKLLARFSGDVVSRLVILVGLVLVLVVALGSGAEMARVVMQAVVSVDGYIAYPDDTTGPLFDWYGNGDTEVSARASGWTFHVSRASADYLQPFWDAVQVTVIGRHLFDTTNGWDGDPAAGDELVVVTHRPLPQAWLADHPDAPFHTAGSVEAGIALAKKLAGDGLVCVTAGDLGGQAFSAGLVDEIAMDVAPVVLGEGVRFFGSHAGTVLLDDPDQVVRGDRVLHLHYTVRR